MHELLKITEETSVQFEAPTITINNKEKLEHFIEQQVAKYSNLVVTETTLAAGKKSKAELNKISKQLNEKRIDIKKSYTEPLTNFENEIKELDTRIKTCVNAIDEQVKVYEEKQIQERLEIVQKTIESVWEEKGVSVSCEIKKEWLNKGSFDSKGKLKPKFVDEIAYLADQEIHHQNKILEDKQAVQKYAEKVHLDSSGWVSQIDLGKSVTEIMQTIDLEVERKLAIEQQTNLLTQEVEVPPLAEELGKMETAKAIEEQGEEMEQHFTLKVTGTNKALKEWAMFGKQLNLKIEVM